MMMNFIQRGWRGEFKPLDIILGSLCISGVMLGIVLLIIGYVHSPKSANAIFTGIYIVMQPVGI